MPGWKPHCASRPACLLIDHANCEKKAAVTALGLMYRYSDHLPLLHTMSRLAREELRHFEQVMAIIANRHIRYARLSASRYAGGLHALVRTHEPARLVDTLIAGAFIEARSCERFAALAPHLDPDLGKFYDALLAPEARHFRDYLALAKNTAESSIDARVALFAAREQALIESPDTELRFHSGPVAA